MSDHHKRRTVGYVRGSPVAQDEARQLETIGPVDRLFSEQVSDRTMDRPQLAELLSDVREGDTVKMRSPESVALSLRDLVDIVEQLRTKGADVEFVDTPAWSTAAPQSGLVMSILEGVVRLEERLDQARRAEHVAIAKQVNLHGPTSDLLQAEVDRFERIKKDYPTDFAKQVLKEEGDTEHSAGFEVELDPVVPILAVADLGFNGRIEQVAVVSRDTHPAQSIDVAPDSGLWAAMEVWLTHTREIWTED